MKLTSNDLDRLKAVNPNPDDAARYAMLLGLKIIEAGFDSDELIRSLQEPSTGLDIDLIMAKKKSRHKFSAVSDCAAFKIGQGGAIDWSIQNIPEDAYNIEIDED